MDKIRILDLGKVSPLRSQVIYHAVAYAMKKNSPDTIILVSPDNPYVCIGLHQELEKEVDMDFCRSISIPVYRREVGGGAVYLDDGQIFAQWIFHGNMLPSSVEERYKLYIQPIVDTYKSIGINANLRPVNDVHVNGKKIGGTGAARMGIAEVVVGSLMFDFDKKTMSKILKVSSEKMRDKIFQSLEEYMTTMREELSELPSREDIKKIYLDKSRAVLGRELYFGQVSAGEKKLAEEIDKMFLSEEWINQKTNRKTKGIKIHEDVHLYESAFKAPGGLIRVTLREHRAIIDDITISGDFTILPSDSIEMIERELIGSRLDWDGISQAILKIYNLKNIQSPGLTPENIRETIYQAVSQT